MWRGLGLRDVFARRFGTPGAESFDSGGQMKIAAARIEKTTNKNCLIRFKSFGVTDIPEFKPYGY